MIFVCKNKFLIRFSNEFFLDRLVQNLSSNDTKDVSKAMQESDVLLKEISKAGFDRTVINTSPSESQKQQTSPGKENKSEKEKVRIF